MEGKYIGDGSIGKFEPSIEGEDGKRYPMSFESDLSPFGLARGTKVKGTLKNQEFVANEISANDFDLREKASLVTACREVAETLDTEAVREWLQDNKESVLTVLQSK